MRVLGLELVHLLIFVAALAKGCNKVMNVSTKLLNFGKSTLGVAWLVAILFVAPTEDPVTYCMVLNNAAQIEISLFFGLALIVAMVESSRTYTIVQFVAAFMCMTLLAMLDKSQLLDCFLEPNCSVNTFVGPLIILFFYHCGMWVWGLFDGFEKEIDDNEEEAKSRSLK
jgi:hypothetical protein